MMRRFFDVESLSVAGRSKTGNAEVANVEIHYGSEAGPVFGEPASQAEGRSDIDGATVVGLTLIAGVGSVIGDQVGAGSGDCEPVRERQARCLFSDDQDPPIGLLQVPQVGNVGDGAHRRSPEILLTMPRPSIAATAVYGSKLS
jgi:hypothetical protein